MMRLFGVLPLPAPFCCALRLAPVSGGPNAPVSPPTPALPTEMSKDRTWCGRRRTLKRPLVTDHLGNRLFMTGHEGDERVVLCYDAHEGHWSCGDAPLRSSAPNFHNPTTARTHADARY